MTYLPRMAFKNLLRYKKRTMITAGAMAYGLMIFIIVRSMLTGVDMESERNLRLYETATGRVMVEGYWDDREEFPLGKSFNPAQIEAALHAAEAAYAPRITFGGDLIFYKNPFPEDGSIPGRFIAIDPIQDTQVFHLKESLVEGEWLAEEEPGVVIGHWLAEDIGAAVGHIVLVETQTIDGYAQVFHLEVVGILNCPNPEITRSGIYLPLSVADEYLEMNGAVTEVNINLGSGKSADEAFAALASRLEGTGLEALDWRILGEDFIAISQTKSQSTGIIIFLILIIAAVGISNTMLMAVYERVRELGMMRALGMRDRSIRGLFLWEAAGIGFLGSLIGVVLGVLINWPLVRWGLDYSFLVREDNFGYRFQGQLYGIWDIPGILIAFVLGVGMAVLVATVSTHRILKLDIPSSLRFQ